MTKEIENNQHSFSKKVLITIGITALFSLAILFVYFAVNVMFLLFAAILLAVFFRSLGEWINHFTKIPEGFAVLIVCLVIIAVFSFAIWLLAPEVADQIIELREIIPQSLNTLGSRISGYAWGNLVLEQIPTWQELFNRIAGSKFLTRISGIFSTTFGVTANIVVIVLMGIYLATSPQYYTKGLIKLFPLSRRDRMREVICEMDETLRWWLVGKSVSMLIIGVLTAVGLWILGIPLALTLGIIAALLAFIPNFGPIIAVAPALLFALVESPTKAIYVLILYLGIQTFESYLITPLVQQKAVSLPPVLTIFFQIFLGVLVGGFGLILATPMLLVIIVLTKMLYIEDVLGDKDVHMPSESSSKS